MKRIFCAPGSLMGGKGGCGVRRGKPSNIDDDTNNQQNGNTKEKWSNAYEKFRKEASDLTEEEAKELWRKTKQCIQVVPIACCLR